MIELYLTDKMREELLKYDIERNERTYDDILYYISNTENQILYDIIYGYGDDEILVDIGFKKEDIKKIWEDDVNIKFTDNDEYYIKEI